MIRKLGRNVWLLTACQTLMMSAGSLIVFVGPIIGAKIAPDEKLATLPAAAMIVGTALFTIPVSLITKRLGRKNTFLSMIFYSIIVLLLASYSVTIASFNLFCASLVMLGFSIATVMQFRFAAMESVTKEQIPMAASTVLLGGIAAAFIGPEVAVAGKDLLKADFAGSFILLAGLFLLGIAFLIPFRNPTVTETIFQDGQRSLSAIIKFPVLWAAMLSAMIGYSVMSFIMTATPISMHMLHGHSIEDTKWVIQSHVMAMFLPSLFTGWLISKLGIAKMMVMGLFAYIIFIVIALSGHDFINYWLALVLLGIGWNFLFVGGTALLPASYRQSERFKVQALNDFLVFSVQALAALSAGWFVYTLGWKTMQVSVIPLLIIQLIAIGIWKRQVNAKE